VKIVYAFKLRRYIRVLLRPGKDCKKVTKILVIAKQRVSKTKGLLE